MRNKIKEMTKKDYVLFVGKVILYTTILLGVIYLYHYSSVGGGNFIYQEF